MLRPAVFQDMVSWRSARTLLEHSWNAPKTDSIFSDAFVMNSICLNQKQICTSAIISPSLHINECELSAIVHYVHCHPKWVGLTSSLMGACHSPWLQLPIDYRLNETWRSTSSASKRSDLKFFGDQTDCGVGTNMQTPRLFQKTPFNFSNTQSGVVVSCCSLSFYKVWLIVPTIHIKKSFTVTSPTPLPNSSSRRMQPQQVAAVQQAAAGREWGSGSNQHKAAAKGIGGRSNERDAAAGGGSIQEASCWQNLIVWLSFLLPFWVYVFPLYFCVPEHFLLHLLSMLYLAPLER